MALDEQRYIDLAMDLWLKDLAPSTIEQRRLVFKQFKKRTELDPVVLLFESRKSQNPDRIMSVLHHFHESLVADGYSEESAGTYFSAMSTFFIANRAPLPRMRKPNPSVAIGELFR